MCRYTPTCSYWLRLKSLSLRFEDTIDSIKADSVDAFSKFTWSSMTFQLYFMRFWHCCSDGPHQQSGSLGACRTHGSLMCLMCRSGNSTNRTCSYKNIRAGSDPHTVIGFPPGLHYRTMFYWQNDALKHLLYIRYSHCKGFHNDKKAITTDYGGHNEPADIGLNSLSCFPHYHFHEQGHAQPQ